MYAVTVIPFAKSIKKEILTYFTGKEVAVGMLVTVPLRKKDIRALVIDIAPIENTKSTIKNADFALRKVKRVDGPSFLEPAFLQTARDLSRYYVTTYGAILYSLVPAALIESGKMKVDAAEKTETPVSILRQEKMLFQAPQDDRLAWYRTYIRESFARKQSVTILLPTLRDITLFEETLSRGIEQYTYTYHSGKTKRTLFADIKKMAAEPHPVLIIATVPFLCISRSDIGTVILEHESSGAYRMVADPGVDLRIVAELWTGHTRTKYIVGDTLVRVETMWRRDRGVFGDVVAPTFRVPPSCPLTIIDVGKTETEKMEKKKRDFISLSPAVREIIEKAQTHSSHLFLFTLRNGLGTVTVCRDCGDTLLCEYCHAPLVLYKKSDKGRIFICNRCKRHTPSDSSCAACRSWNLSPLGIGIDLVYEEFVRAFPDVPVFRIDRERTKTDDDRQEVIQEFYATKKAVLIGTEMALPHLDNKVSESIVVSFDSLFHIPSFRIEERILGLILFLSSITEKELYIQTRNPSERILGVAEVGSLLSWYRSELAEREQFSYPPYTTIIKVTVAGSLAALDSERTRLAETFGSYSPDIFRSAYTQGKGVYLLHMVLRIPRREWSLRMLTDAGKIDELLERKLRDLPQSYRIAIDPENLL